MGGTGLSVQIKQNELAPVQI